MMSVQHSCEGLLRFILLDNTVTVDMQVMTLKEFHIFKQVKHSSEKGFIPWSKEITPSSTFLKRVRETQTKNSKDFLESILNQDLEPNFRPKQPCRFSKVARLLDSQFIQHSGLKMNAHSTETTQDNIPNNVRDMEHQAQNESRPSKQSRRIDQHSDWSDPEDRKDDQARAKPVDIQNPQSSTSYANESSPLRCPNTYPKVLNLGTGRGKGKGPLHNWTSVVKGKGHGIIID